MKAIQHLQKRTPKISAKDESNQTVQISVRPVKPEPEIETLPPPPPKPQKIPTPTPPITPTEESIRPNTKVYAVWFDDDALVYRVIEVNILHKFE